MVVSQPLAAVHPILLNRVATIIYLKIKTKQRNAKFST